MKFSYYGAQVELAAHGSLTSIHQDPTKRFLRLRLFHSSKIHILAEYYTSTSGLFLTYLSPCCQEMLDTNNYYAPNLSQVRNQCSKCRLPVNLPHGFNVRTEAHVSARNFELLEYALGRWLGDQAQAPMERVLEEAALRNWFVELEEALTLVAKTS